ncbi:DUF5665 domain-containing protein [Bacillota bacterium Meth-B3]|nr:DUF5665 domain-containing protein [Christensenellaceae bacterium]MEA5069893.1 DUF5665 domain-containing protein [Christensenellaceae bacterium]
MKEEMIDRLEQIAGRFERMRLTDYLRYVNDKRRFFTVNFFAGVMHGLGMAVGFTLLGAVLVVILQRVVTHNIPLIGDFLAEVVKVVKSRS